MNTKIIVALVIAIAVVGLTGAASASLYDDYMSRISTQTDITGTHFSSSSQISVSGIPTEYTSESLIVAELVNPTYPPLDIALHSTQIKGSDYSISESTVSTPSGSIDEYEISNPQEVDGYTTCWNCAMWGAGEPQIVVELPTETDERLYFRWYSVHEDGAAYPASLSQTHNIYWP
jgi:hypothetical protein